MQMDIETVAETIISLERQALERWNTGDVEANSSSTPKM